MKQPEGTRKLSSIRKDLGLSQEEFAKVLNISLSGYALKEQGKAPLKAIELKTISAISGVPMEDIEIPC